MSQFKDINQDVTDTIMESLKISVIPWRKPSKPGGAGVLPTNLFTKKKFRGINRLLLWLEALIKEYSTGCWMTFRQCKTLGGHIKMGEKATRVIFWNWEKKKEFYKEDAKNREGWKRDEINQGYRVINQPSAQYYNVFNLDQVEDLPIEKFPVIEIKNRQPVEAAEDIIKNYATMPGVIEGKPAYIPKLDKISIYDMLRFETPEEYYCRLLHECVHSTGHQSRLKRDGITKQVENGSPCYSFEELIAEIGASFLNAEAGIADAAIENSPAYTQGWLKALKKDKKLVLMAASKAQSAADYILGESSTLEG